MNDKELIEALKKEMERRTGNLYYERELEEVIQLSKLLGQCKSFVDAGASLGPYTWAANMIMTNGSITAVEANPMLCKHLQEQWVAIKESGRNQGNELRVINAALSDEQGTLDFHIDKNNYLNSYIGTLKEEQGGDATHEKIELPALSLDHIFSSEIPEFVKIDIEGAEWRALKGARKLLEKRKTRFLIEIHPWGDSSNNIRPSDVFSLMSRVDYSVRRLNQHWLFTPEKPGLSGKLKALFYGFILDHPSLRKLAKSILVRG